MRLIPSEWRELSALQRDVLVGIAVDGPATAYSVHKKVNPDADPGGVYKPVRKLKEKGLIEQISDGDTKNEGNELDVTEKGRRVVSESVEVPAARLKDD